MTRPMSWYDMTDAAEYELQLILSKFSFVHVVKGYTKRSFACRCEGQMHRMWFQIELGILFQNIQ